MLNSVFGKREDVVAEAKLRRFSAEELMGFAVVGFPGSFRVKRGVGQQPWKHNCVTSLVQGDCISFSLYSRRLWYVLSFYHTCLVLLSNIFIHIYSFEGYCFSFKNILSMI